MCEIAFNGVAKAGAGAAAAFEAQRGLRLKLVEDHRAYVKRLLGENGFLEYYAANQRIIDGMRNGGATAPDIGYLVF